MKKNIKKIAAIVATGLLVTVPVLSLSVATSGCNILGGGTSTNSVPLNTNQIAATALILQNAAWSGALAAINPPTGSTNNAPYFNAVAQAIGVFITGKDATPASFQQALINVRMPQANNLWVQLGIATVVDLYQLYYGNYVQNQVNSNAVASLFLVSIQNGFNQALGNPVTNAAPVGPPGALGLVHKSAGPYLPRPILKK